MAARTKIVGCILAGGLARRMGGGDKCLIPVSGMPMLEHARNRLEPQVGRIIINANGDPARFSDLELPVVPDTVKGFAGPLAGILSGLLWTGQNQSDAESVLTVAGDTPFFPDNLANRLAEGKNNDSDAIALACSGGKSHPVFGLWPVSVANDLQNWLNGSNSRKVLDFVDRHSNHLVEFETVKAGSEDIDPFFNVNSPEDIETANRYAELT